MNRHVALAALLSLASPALAQDAAPAPAPAQEAAPASEAAVDAAALHGKVESLAEQYAETKADVSALKKLKLSGYVQGRWAWKEDNVYDLTTAEAPSQTSFFVRRARFKAAYDADWSQFVVQLDATPRYVLVKEAFASVKLPWQGFSVDAGLQLFPFGYEVAVRSSSDLDLLERAEVTKWFLEGEYDVGVALRGEHGPVNFKVGLFNGNGVAGWSTGSGSSGLDNDQRKDVIGRVGVDLGMVTGGVSGWYGQGVDYTTAPNATFDRVRAGADLQVYLDLLPIGGTAVKGEYIWGKTALGTDGGGAGKAGSFDVEGAGWYALVTQNVGPWNQLAVRYESIEKDLDADGADPETALQAALHTFVGGNYKLSVAWFHPIQNAAGDDPKKDQLILQAQAKF